MDEHHIGVYASKADGHIVKVVHPKGQLHGSRVSSTLAAAAMNGKYVSAIPLYRLEQEFNRCVLAITWQNMANWMMRLGEKYLAVMYDYPHQKLYSHYVIQADKIPVLVNRDERPACSKSYRNTSPSRKFMNDYAVLCVTDGYQIYHTVEKELEALSIAGCWVHGCRRFDESLSVIPKEIRKNAESYLAMKQNQAIYGEEGYLKNLQFRQRQLSIWPLVEALFMYLRKHNGDVLLNNNASERTIRGICIGKKNWEIIDTINGSKNICDHLQYRRDIKRE